MNQSINRQDIFLIGKDRKSFVLVLAAGFDIYGVKMIAYILIEPLPFLTAGALLPGQSEHISVPLLNDLLNAFWSQLMIADIQGEGDYKSRAD